MRQRHCHATALHDRAASVSALSLSPSLFRLFSDLHWAINNVIPSRALAIDYTEKANQLTRQQKINKREKQPEANEQLRKEKKAHTAAHRLEQTAKTIKIDKLKKSQID